MIAAGGQAQARPAASATQALRAVIADFDRYQRAVDPISAGLEGDKTALRVWPDDSPRAVAARKAELEGFSRRLVVLKAAKLSPEDRLNRD